MSAEAELVEVLVLDVIPQYIGMNAFMELSGVYGMLNQHPFATSLLVKPTKSRAAFHLSITATGRGL